MLSKNTLNIASAVAAKLVDAGIAVLPNGANELSHLNGVSSQAGVVINYSEENFESFIPNIIEASRNEFHDKFLTDSADEIVRLANSHINHSKNVVAPLVQQFAEKYAAFLGTLSPVNAATSFVIDSRKIPGVVTDPIFIKSSVAEPNFEKVEINNYFNLKQLDEEGIINFLKFGQKALDNEILKWILESEGRVLRMYDTVLSGGTQSEYSLREINLANCYDQLDMGILLCLAAEKLNADVAETTMSLAKYKQACTDYKQKGAWLIKEALQTINTGVSSGRLVVAAETINKKLTVHDAVYKEWLNVSGKPEILLGMFVSFKRTYTVAELNERADYFEQTWLSYNALNQMQFEETVDSTIRKWLATEAFCVCEAIEAEQAIKATAKKMVEDVVCKLDKACITSVYEVALEIVAKGVFFFTSAYPFLSTMHKLGVDNPNINVRSAATLAAIDYIGEYLYTLLGSKKD